jgi:hypothetical protein
MPTATFQRCKAACAISHDITAATNTKRLADQADTERGPFEHLK